MRPEVEQALLNAGVFRESFQPLADWQLELRLKVLKQVENDPASLDMADWWNGIEDDEQGECKTTRCIAGWARHFAQVPQGTGLTYELVGITVLGLTYDEFYEDRDPMSSNSGLFYMSDQEAVERLRQLCDAPE